MLMVPPPIYGLYIGSMVQRTCSCMIIICAYIRYKKAMNAVARGLLCIIIIL